jgi:hypothetical protein
MQAYIFGAICPSDGKGAALVFAPSAEGDELASYRSQKRSRQACSSLSWFRAPTKTRLLFLALVTQGPHVSRDRLEIFVRKLHTAHRRHGTWVLIWLDHAVSDRFGDRR